MLCMLGLTEVLISASLLHSVTPFMSAQHVASDHVKVIASKYALCDDAATEIDPMMCAPVIANP